MITGIPSHEAHLVWDKAGPLLEKALNRFDCGYSSEDVLTQIQMKDMQLWVANDYQAIMVTRIDVYPQHKILSALFTGGSKLLDWSEAMEDTLYRFAKANGCKYVEGCGRKGWVKHSKQYGYEEYSTLVRRKVDD